MKRKFWRGAKGKPEEPRDQRGIVAGLSGRIYDGPDRNLLATALYRNRSGYRLQQLRLDHIWVLRDGHYGANSDRHIRRKIRADNAMAGAGRAGYSVGFGADTWACPNSKHLPVRLFRLHAVLLDGRTGGVHHAERRKLGSGPGDDAERIEPDVYPWWNSRRLRTALVDPRDRDRRYMGADRRRVRRIVGIT